MISLDTQIHKEILFELQTINDKSDDRFFELLKHIKSMIERGKSIKDIKRVIYSSDINFDLKDNLGEMINQQASNILGTKSTVSLTQQSIAGYTFNEAIKERKQSVRKQSQRFMVQAQELHKDGKELNTLLDNEVEKYTKQNEAFYRTQTKAGREYAYTKLDEDDNIKGWMSIAVLDNKTSAICLSLHNVYYSKEEYKTRDNIPYPIPRHPNCRSMLVAVYKGTHIKSYKEVNLDTFLRNNEDIGKDIMGIKKYEMYKEKGIKFQNFVDIKHSRYYTNSEIQKRLNIK